MKSLNDPHCSPSLLLGDDPKSVRVEVVARPPGVHISVLRTRSALTFSRRDGQPVELADLLLSDHYSDGIERLKQIPLKSFPIGITPFAYDYNSSKLVLDQQKSSSGLPPSYPIINPRGSSLPPKIVEALLSRDSQTIWDVYSKISNVESLPIPRCLLFRRGSFAITVENPEGGERLPRHTDLYSLISVEFSKLARLEILGTLPEDGSPDGFVALVDRLFLDYVNRSQYPLEELDLGMPEPLQIKLDTKLPLLSPGVRKLIEEHPGLYDIYRLCLSILRKPKLRNNPYASQERVRAHEQLCIRLRQIQEHGALAVPLPLLPTTTPDKQ